MSEPKPQGNVLFLICSACEQSNQPDFGIKLIARAQDEPGRITSSWRCALSRITTRRIWKPPSNSRW